MILLYYFYPMNSLSSLTLSPPTELMSMGVKLSSREVTTISERNGRTFSHPDSNNVIQEKPWTLNNMLERYSFLDTYPWLSSQVSHTVLTKLRIPQDLLVTSISYAPFNAFTFWKGDVELNFQVTSTPLTQGMLAAVFVPLSAQRFIDSTIVPNFSNVSLNQVVYLYANANTSAKMFISYNSPQAYIDLTQDLITTRNALGYVYIIVFNPIQLAATASDTSSVSVFSRFSNNQFKVPRVSTIATTFAKPQSLYFAKPQAMTMLAKAAVSTLLSEDKEPPPSSSRTVIRKLTDKLIPKGVFSDAIDTALGIFGLDNPTDPSLQNPSKLIGTQRMNFVQGGETIDKLSLFPAQTYESTFETFATEIDEMSLNFLKEKFTYLGSFTFSTTSAVGDVVASWPINPFPIELFNMDATQVPLLSYISVPFQFWKGGLTYKIQVVSTSFQTGKLFFAFNFNTFTPATGLTINQLTSQYGEAIEINQGSNEFQFTVPYVATTPYLDVPNSNIPSIEDTIGYINVVVINPLVAPNNTPITITLNVFFAGNDDFELSTLTQSNNLIPSQPLQLAINNDPFTFLDFPLPSPSSDPINIKKALCARPQSVVAPLNTPLTGVDLATEEMVAPNATSSPRHDITQMSILSVRNLLKKYQMLQNYTLSFPSVGQGGLVTTIPISSLFGGQHFSSSPFLPNTVPLNPGIWNHFQLLYRQYKGPLRFKFMLNETSSNASFSIFFQPPVNNQTASPSDIIDAFANSMYMPQGPEPAAYNGRVNATRTANLVRIPVAYVNGLQKSAEFEIPFSSKFFSVISWTGAAAENELATSPLIDLGSLVVYTEYATFTGTANTSNVLNAFISFGDESRFGNLFQIPMLAVNSTVDSTGTLLKSTWPDSYGTGAPVSNTLFRL